MSEEIACLITSPFGLVHFEGLSPMLADIRRVWVSAAPAKYSWRRRSAKRHTRCASEQTEHDAKIKLPQARCCSQATLVSTKRNIVLHLRAEAGPAVSAAASPLCSFMESASCSGCCCLRSTTSFQSSRSCFTRSSCDSMCCCEIWSRRKTLWSAFFAIMSKMFRKRCEHRWRHALSTRKAMFSAHSSQPSNSTSASLWSTPSVSSKRGPGKTPTTCANFTTPFVRDATQCLRSSKGFSLTFVSRTSCTASIWAFQFCSSIFLCFSIFRTASLFFWMSTSWEALHCQSVHLLAELQYVAFMLAQPSLNATHAQVQC